MRSATWVLIASGMLRAPGMHATPFCCPGLPASLPMNWPRGPPTGRVQMLTSYRTTYHRSSLMAEAVSQMLRLLCALLVQVPVGTNLGLLPLLWMLLSGQLLVTRGAVFPGLNGVGLSARAVRRAWAALGQGDWTSGDLLARWQTQVAREGRWQPHQHGGYRPVA